MQILPSGEDRYVLLDRIGKGGFGYVYRAIDNASGELVAAKLIDLEEAGTYEIDVVYIHNVRVRG
jgi:serine/threonine protein kinase